MDEKEKYLWKVVENEKIIVLYDDLIHTEEKLQGIYISRGDTGPTICLEQSLGEREHKCALCEEVSHHMVGVASSFTSVNKNYSQIILKDKDEYRALKWSTNILIPDHELCRAIIKDCLNNAYEIADYFNVTLPIAMAKLTFLRQRLYTNGYRAKGMDVLKKIHLVAGCGG